MLSCEHDVVPVRRTVRGSGAVRGSPDPAPSAGDVSLHCIAAARLPAPSAWVLAILLAATWCSTSLAAEPQAATQFRKNVEPILAQFCLGCHDSESRKGGVAFDRFESATALVE